MEAKQRDVQAVADLETARAELQALVEGSLIEMEARHQAAVAALELAEAADAAAGSRLSYLGLVDAQGRAAGADLTVPAPIGGTVLRLDVAVGSVVSEGQAVARVADLSSVWAWCDLFPDTLSRLDAISLPLEAALTVTGAGEQAFPGRLDFITSGTAEPGHTVRARIVLDNRPGRLRPGLAAAAVVTLPSRGPVSVVPASAVLEDGGVRFVFSWWKGDLWRRQDVEMGPRVGDDVVITRGLVPGDKVVAQGGFLLKSDILREKMGAGCAD
jgi:cobalt-zinc-cadmium efflux system membrane fusion protein